MEVVFLNKQLRGSLILVLTAMIWGAAFTAQSAGMDLVGPFTMQATRFLLAGLVNLPFALAMRKQNRMLRMAYGFSKKQMAFRAIICGLILTAASTLQQYGLQFTTPGKSGFITALYIVLVPIAGIFIGKKTSFTLWIGVLCAAVGLYFLCIQGDFQIGMGDLLTLGSAVFFAAQILFIDYIGSSMSGVTLSCIQAFVCSAVSFVLMLIFEKPVLADIFACWLPICYTGILSGGLAYTLQIIGQQGTDPTLASLVMSLESVFAVLFALLLLHQTPSSRELTGCAFMFCGIILSQLPPIKRNKKM